MRTHALIQVIFIPVNVFFSIQVSPNCLFVCLKMNANSNKVIIFKTSHTNYQVTSLTLAYSNGFSRMKKAVKMETIQAFNEYERKWHRMPHILTVSTRDLILPPTTPPHNTLNSIPNVPGMTVLPIGLSRNV